MTPENAAEQRIVLVKRMVDTRHIVRTAEKGRRIPPESRGVQTVTGAESVWRRVARKEFGDCGVDTKVLRVGCGKVIRLNAIQIGSAGAVANAGSKSARQWVYQSGHIPGDRDPVDLQRIGRVGNEVAIN